MLKTTKSICMFVYIYIQMHVGIHVYIYMHVYIQYTFIYCIYKILCIQYIFFLFFFLLNVFLSERDFTQSRNR